MRGVGHEGGGHGSTLSPSVSELAKLAEDFEQM